MVTKLQNAPVVKLWLWTIAALIFLMVIVGGATRLTDSGLSITEWKPLLGAIPPLNQSDWLVAFAKYQQIPEYQIQNKGMSLEEFKFIYWWEWAHRFLGRFIGIVFIVPLVYFVMNRRITKQLWPRLFFLFVMGGLQGALGWYMVSSGLVERTDVSQYRLTAHLTLAVVLFAAVVFTALTFNKTEVVRWGMGTSMAALFVVLLFVQVAAGGFVAGLDAGHASYTWPQMNGAFVPEGIGSLQPFWKNVFENALTVQFIHRILAYMLLAFAIVQAFLVRSRSAHLVLVAVLGQAMLGILTVVWQVPLATALMHQGGALIVLTLSLMHLCVVNQAPVPNRR